MKKLIAILILITFIAPFWGCSRKEQPNTPLEEEQDNPASNEALLNQYREETDPIFRAFILEMYEGNIDSAKTYLADSYEISDLTVIDDTGNSVFTFSPSYLIQERTFDTILDKNTYICGYKIIYKGDISTLNVKFQKDEDGKWLIAIDGLQP